MTDVEANTGERLLFLHDADVVAGPVGALERLTTMLNVEVPRHPGFGTSFDEQSAEWDSVGDLAQHYLHDLGHGHGADRLHLAGAGFGGWIALEMAVRAPTRFASLTLVSPYGVKLFGPMDREFADILLLDPSELVELGWADPATCHSLRMPGYPQGLDDHDYEQAFDERAALARFAWKPFLHDPRLRRWLHILRLPTLVVSGAHDRLVAPEHSRALAELIPGARYAEIAGAGHYPYLEAPDEFIDVVAPFVSNTVQLGADQ